MQKLQEILRAEEAARHSVAEARERADAIVRDAEAEAKVLLETERAAASAEAARLRDGILQEARERASAIGSEWRAASVDEALMSDAVAAALAVLEG